MASLNTFDIEHDGHIDVESEILEVADRMSVAIAQVARGAQEAAANAKGAEHAAQVGQSSAERASESMGVVSEIMADVENKIQSFASRMERIDSTVAAIKSIADQTNLLALNAAIEAARAGDAGRGFAVVADEVRSLAERSRKAASEITKTISEIRGDSDRLVAIIGQSMEKTGESDALIQNTYAVLSDIVHQVAENAARIEQLALATDEQSIAAKKIAHKVGSLSRQSGRFS